MRKHNPLDIRREDVPKIVPNEDLIVPPLPSLADDDDIPYAEVEQTGRFTWKISIYHGVFRWGPDGLWYTYIGTENGASRRAEKLLDKYEKLQDKQHEQKMSRFTVY